MSNAAAAQANLAQVQARWDDLRFPASVARSHPPSSEHPAFDGDVPGLLFRHTATDEVRIIAQLPHSWYVGTPLRPHVHWSKTTSAAGGVLWRMEYKWAPIGAVIDAAWTPVSSSTVVGGAGDVADQHVITPFGDLDAYDRVESDMLLIKLSRVHTDVADTYAASARLLEFDIHYRVRGLGSLRDFGDG